MVDKLIGEEEAKDAFQERKAKVRCAWEQEYVAQRVSDGAEEVQARAEIAALHHQVLLGSAIFITQSGAKITVGEILFDPGKYEGEIGPDPIEGRSYGTTTARVMAARPGGAPVIFSYAHGGMIYTLKHDVGSIATGFETAFKAKDKSAQRSFTVAMANAEITQVDRTRLVKRAADFFDVGINDLKRDIKTEAAAAEIQRKQSQPRKDGRFVLRYFPAEHARSVETVAKYVGSLNPPIIYDHGGRLTIIVPVPIQKSTLHRWAVRLLDRALAALRVNRHIRFQAGDEPEDIPPPQDVIEGLIANDPPRMPPLFAIRSTPQVSPTGEINLTGGYHHGIYYDGACGALAVPERPTLEDAKAAWEFVKRELLCEFPFDSEIDVAVTLALLVTMLTRLDFPTAPAFVISAPKSGTGKSLLASILIFLILGTDAEPSTYKSDDEPEIRKVLTAHIAEGAQVVFFDNVTRSIGCAPLDALLTSPTWKDRVLGTSTMYSGRQNVTVVLTSNNAKVVGDTVRRCLRIRLNAKGFEDPTTRPISNRNLRQTVEEKRGALIASLLTIVRWHRQAGLPGACQLGSFEDWAQQVGGLVQTLTGLDPVASQAFLRENDLKEEAAHQFYRLWEEWFGGQEVTANRVYQEWKLASSFRKDIAPEPPFSEICEIVATICGKNLNPTWFAMRVADFRDVQYGTRVMKRVETTDHANIARYQLVAVDGSEPINPEPKVDFSKPSGSRF